MIAERQLVQGFIFLNHISELLRQVPYGGGCRNEVERTNEPLEITVFYYAEDELDSVIIEQLP